LEFDDENPDYWFAIADARYKLGQFEESEAAYLKVVELNPTDMEAWLDFSSIYFDNKDHIKAIEIMAEAIKHNPEIPELYYRLVAYLFADGRYNDALNTLELALSISPEKHTILFEYLPQLQGNQIIVDIIKRYSQDR
jgi:tetratricopeptide (TPR) repeat protein